MPMNKNNLQGRGHKYHSVSGLSSLTIVFPIQQGNNHLQPIEHQTLQGFYHRVQYNCLDTDSDEHYKHLLN